MGTLAELTELKWKRQMKLNELSDLNDDYKLYEQALIDMGTVIQHFDSFVDDVKKRVKGYNEGDYVWQGYHYYKMKKFRANCGSYMLVVEHIKDVIVNKKSQCYNAIQDTQGEINTLTTQIDNFVVEG